MQHQQPSRFNNIHRTKAIVATSLPTNDNKKYLFNYNTLTKKQINTLVDFQNINDNYNFYDVNLLINEDTFLKNFYVDFKFLASFYIGQRGFVLPTDTQQIGHLLNNFAYAEVIINETVVYRQMYPLSLNLIFNKDKKTELEMVSLGLPYQNNNGYNFQTKFGSIVNGHDLRNPCRNLTYGSQYIIPLFWFLPFFNNPEILPTGTKLQIKFYLRQTAWYHTDCCAFAITENSINRNFTVLRQVGLEYFIISYIPIRKYQSLNQSLVQPFYKYSSFYWENIINDYYYLTSTFNSNPYIINKTWYIKMFYPDYLMWYFVSSNPNEQFTVDARQLFWNEARISDPLVATNEISPTQSSWTVETSSYKTSATNFFGVNSFSIANDVFINNFKIYFEGQSLQPIFHYNYNDCKCSFNDYIRRSQHFVDNYLTQEFSTIQQNEILLQPYCLNLRNLVTSKFLQIGQKEFVPFVFEMSIINQNYTGLTADEKQIQILAYVPRMEEFIINRNSRTCTKL